MTFFIIRRLCRLVSRFVANYLVISLIQAVHVVSVDNTYKCGDRSSGGLNNKQPAVEERNHAMFVNWNIV